MSFFSVAPIWPHHMVDGNKIIITFYFIYCVCANYKCCIIPPRGPDLENKVSCILYWKQ